MPINSLRQFSGAASTAYTTARSTFKAMAEAAVPPPETAAATAEGLAPVAPVRPSGDALRGAERTLLEKRRAGARKGVSLDSYA
ncbi:hypothetical protein ODJ79_22560 [Actinoplanes sp. KI2]|uniref:hypothetical protein n=1 Tax=Actinoplanes sp. KI2 TaxID=2983315 RepID=UPI0021D5CA98|nr:hypothetical protein [Actinoplanes sp. KI2]MCU7726523.1 hypothetical protein [Actinoplanes sp. KI2]